MIISDEEQSIYCGSCEHLKEFCENGTIPSDCAMVQEWEKRGLKIGTNETQRIKTRTDHGWTRK